ncbi:hypothetical protein COOONC_10493 [Cooperia oncophora]
MMNVLEEKEVKKTVVVTTEQLDDQGEQEVKVPERQTLESAPVEKRPKEVISTAPGKHEDEARVTRVRREERTTAEKREVETVAREEPPIDVISPAKEKEQRKAETPLTTPTVSPRPRQHSLEGGDVPIHKQPLAVSPVLMPVNRLTEQELAEERRETVEKEVKQVHPIREEARPAVQEKVEKPPKKKDSIMAQEMKVVQEKHEDEAPVTRVKKVERRTSEKKVVETVVRKEPPIEVISPQKEKEQRKVETPVATPTLSPLPRQHRMEDFGEPPHKQPPAVSPALVPPNRLTEQELAVERKETSDVPKEIKQAIPIRREAPTAVQEKVETAPKKKEPTIGEEKKMVQEKHGR